MAKKNRKQSDSTTEEKIKIAARKVFTEKGYSAARTRDIADESGINLALLNYYFRSKEKLFDIVMMENMQQFLMAMRGVFNNETLSLTEKVAAIADNYVIMLKANPDLPLFILSELKANPDKLVANMGIKSILFDTSLFKQITERIEGGVNPVHFVMNIISLCVFPFVASPLIKSIGDLKQPAYDKLMDERKKLIPMWMDAMFPIT